MAFIPINWSPKSGEEVQNALILRISSLSVNPPPGGEVSVGDDEVAPGTTGEAGVVIRHFLLQWLWLTDVEVHVVPGGAPPAPGVEILYNNDP